jgi:hypothetical protein
MTEPSRSWTTGELAIVDRAAELQIASRRPDDSIRSFVTVWMVRVGTDVYVRSGAGYGGVSRWFPRARDAGSGTVRVDGQEWQAIFTHLEPNDPVHLCTYGGSFGMTDAATHEHTLRIEPASAQHGLRRAQPRRT